MASVKYKKRYDYAGALKRLENNSPTSSYLKNNDPATKTQYNNLATRLNTVGVKNVDDDRGFIGKALNLEKNQGTLMDIFEILDRPANAIRNVITPEDRSKDVLTNLWEGLSGKQDTSGKDLIDRTFGEGDSIMNFIMKNNTDEKFGIQHILRSVGNIGAELVFDPLNWVGMGTFDDVVKLGGGKFGKVVDDISKYADDLSKITKGKDGKWYELIKDAKDIYKPVVGFNKGRDLVGYGITKGMKGASGKLGSLASKVAPDTYQSFQKIKTILTKSFIQSPEFSLKLLKDGHTVEEINRIQGTLDYFKKQAEMAMDVSLDNFNKLIDTKLADDALSSKDLKEALLRFAQADADQELMGLYDGKLISDLGIDDFKKIASTAITRNLGNAYETYNPVDLLRRFVDKDKGGAIYLTGKQGVRSTNGFGKNLVKYINKQIEALEGIKGFVGPENIHDYRVIVPKVDGEDYQRGLEALRKVMADLGTDDDQALKAINAFIADGGTQLPKYFNAKQTGFDGIKDKRLEKLLKEELLDTPTQEINNINDTFLKKAFDETGFENLDRYQNYVPHLATPQTKEITKANRLIRNANLEGVKGGKLKRAKLKKGMTGTTTSDIIGRGAKPYVFRKYQGNPSEINQLMYEVYGKVGKTQAFQALLKTNPYEIFSENMQKYFKEINSQSVFKNILGDITAGTLADGVHTGLIVTPKLDFLFKGVDTVDDMRNALAKSGILGQDTTRIMSKELYTDNYIEKIYRSLDAKSNMGELEQYMMKSGMTLGKTRFENVNEIIKKLEFTKEFGNDELRKLVSNLEEAFGSGPVWIDTPTSNLLLRTKELKDGSNEIMKVYSKYLNMWKQSKLFNLGFPFRNAFGDSTNLFAGGMPINKVLTGFKRGVQDVSYINLSLQKKVAKSLAETGSELTQLSAKDQALWKTWSAFKKTGMASQLKTIDEYGDILLKMTGETDYYKAVEVMKQSKKMKRAFEIIIKSSEMVDVANRFSAWQWASDPANFAKYLEPLGYLNPNDFLTKALFNYNDLSNMDNKMRMLFPFYTFMKKNTEFHMHNALRNTRRYSQMVDVANNLYAEGDIDKEDMPSYVMDNFQIPIGKTKDGKIRYLKVNPSFVEAWDTLTGKNIVNAVTPAIKLPVEQVTGLNLFTGQDKDQSLGGFAKNLWDTTVPSILSTQNVGDLINKKTDIPDYLLKSLVGTTDPETNQYYYYQDLLNRLQDKQRDYEKKNKTDLPTILDLKKQGLIK